MVGAFLVTNNVSLPRKRLSRRVELKLALRFKLDRNSERKEPKRKESLTLR